MLTRKELERYSSSSGFNMDLIEKVHHMQSILSILTSDRTIMKDLVLKGGTSLNFIYLEVPRLSIDIDLNFIGTLDRDQMLMRREQLDIQTKDLGESAGYYIKDRGSSYIISRSSFGYRKVSGPKDHVKVETNYLQRLPLSDVVERKVVPLFLGNDDLTVPTYTIEELLAQKAAACLERKLPRDIYDLHMISGLRLDMEKARDLVTAYLCMFSRTGRVDLSFIQGMDKVRMRNELIPFLRSDDGIDIDLMLKNAYGLMEELFDLDDDQNRFIRSFYDDRKVTTGLILRDVPELDRHPSLIHQLERMGH